MSGSKGFPFAPSMDARITKPTKNETPYLRPVSETNGLERFRYVTDSAENPHDGHFSCVNSLSKFLPLHDDS